MADVLQYNNELLQHCTTEYLVSVYTDYVFAPEPDYVSRLADAYHQQRRRQVTEILEQRGVLHVG